MLKIDKSISLVGMPGAGKTSIGREIAKITKIQFFDADNEIEKSAGMEIADIFEKYGEEHFRSGETKVIKRILDGKQCILSTGGGAFINDKTRKVITKNSISVFVDVDVENLFKRVKEKKHRPLLQGEDLKKQLENTFKKRYDIYKQADIIVNYEEKMTVNKMAKLIIKKLNENR